MYYCLCVVAVDESFLWDEHADQVSKLWEKSTVLWTEALDWIAYCWWLFRFYVESAYNTLWHRGCSINTLQGRHWRLVFLIMLHLVDNVVDNIVVGSNLLCQKCLWLFHLHIHQRAPHDCSCSWFTARGWSISSWSLFRLILFFNVFIFFSRLYLLWGWVVWSLGRNCWPPAWCMKTILRLIFNCRTKHLWFLRC